MRVMFFELDLLQNKTKEASLVCFSENSAPLIVLRVC